MEDIINKKTSNLILIFLIVIILILVSSCSNRENGANFEPPKEATEKNNENNKPKLSIKTMPEVYSLAMSSSPGIHLGITMESKVEPDIQFKTNSGNFISWEDGNIEELGNDVRLSIAQSGSIYWIPDKDTKDGDIVTVDLVDSDGKITATTEMTVKIQEQNYSLSPVLNSGD